MSMSDKRRQVMANRIKEGRQDLALTQDELAKRLNVYASTVSRYETGERIPSPRHMRKLAEALGKSVRYLRASDLYDEEDTINGTG